MSNWETDEVINFLMNDEGAYTTTRRMSVNKLRRWIEAGNAPTELYESFKCPPASSFDDVDWEAVAKAVEE